MCEEEAAERETERRHSSLASASVRDSVHSQKGQKKRAAAYSQCICCSNVCRKLCGSWLAWLL
jgi:hypothetical protein